MEISESIMRADLERREALYAPLYRWCELLVTPHNPGAPKIDIDAEFYRALDQIVRCDGFSVEEVSELLAAHFCGDLDFPECAAYHEELCARTKAIREFLEARGEVRTLDFNGPPVH